jgi:hypothetical protein
MVPSHWSGRGGDRRGAPLRYTDKDGVADLEESGEAGDCRGGWRRGRVWWWSGSGSGSGSGELDLDWLVFFLSGGAVEYLPREIWGK